MRRRHKHLIFVICTLFSIGYISFRILSGNDQTEWTDEVENSPKKITEASEYYEDVNFIKEHRPRFETPGNDRQKRISSLLEKYSIDWRSPIQENIWHVAEKWVSARKLYPESSPLISSVLRYLSSAPIVKADFGYGGTQLKITLLLEGGQLAVFKPRWYPRDFLVTGEPYAGRDRHNAEVAAFHLNRLLNFSRVPIVVGRTIDLRNEIKSVATPRLINTFFTREGNLCFYGKCLYCKGPDDGVCAQGDKLEGVVILWLPKKLTLEKWKHPWRRSYKEGRRMRWETDDSYCRTFVKNTSPYDKPPRLLDIMDTCILDFLVGNADRHRYETFKNINNSMLIILDNGKSFGNPFEDELSILAPFTQCCLLRRSTYERLQMLTDGVLSEVLKTVMELEPLAPVLTQPHLLALDRRLKVVMDKAHWCMKQYGEMNILVDE
ncbi:DgyrCDS5542 [Dimorphilus gyrociliatus]|uniref:DgyrCDS5542 n=1 Tax=Dimorphilus gyrociliatus TaxID=2664684 RepID=A0A7I8VLU4_9ANNE|nr:DgyrCDS5542 [Dimorphilus gyrociliatus]